MSDTPNKEWLAKAADAEDECNGNVSVGGMMTDQRIHDIKDEYVGSEAGADVCELVDEVRALRQQRDALLSACEAAAEVFDKFTIRCDEEEAVLTQLRTALATPKGAKP